MAAVSGTGGSITQASIPAAIGISNWTINDTIDTHDITTFADLAIAKWLGGIKRWAGTFGGNWEATQTLDVGDGAAASFLMILGSSDISGTILVTGLTISTNVNSQVTAEYTFVGNGTPTYG